MAIAQQGSVDSHVGHVAYGSADRLWEKIQRELFPVKRTADLAGRNVPPQPTSKPAVEVNASGLEPAVCEIDGRGGVSEVEPGNADIGEAGCPRTVGQRERTAEASGE
jgi:hypothetical protein